MPVEISFAHSGDLTAWDTFLLVKHCPYPYLMSPFRNVVEKSFGHKPMYFMAKRDGKIAGVLPVFYVRSCLFGRVFASMPFLPYGGVVAEDSTIAQAMLDRVVEEARERKVDLLIIRQGESSNFIPAVQDPCFHIRQEKVTFTLPMPTSSTELMTRFSSPLRTKIRKSEKKGMVCRVGDGNDLPAFYRIFSKRMKELGTPVYHIDFFRNIFEEWQECRLVTIWWGNQPVAGAFLIGWKGRMEIVWAATDIRYNSILPGYMLYYNAMKYSIENGYSLFDFGRCTPDEGPYHFKLGWGGIEKPISWIYWTASGDPPVLNRRNRKYTLLSDCWKKIPLPIANILGPRIIGNIP